MHININCRLQYAKVKLISILAAIQIFFTLFPTKYMQQKIISNQNLGREKKILKNFSATYYWF